MEMFDGRRQGGRDDRGGSRWGPPNDRRGQGLDLRGALPDNVPHKRRRY